MRVVLFWLCYLTILVGAAMLKLFVPASAAMRELVWAATGSAGVFASTLLFLRWERRSAADIGLRFERSSVLRFAIGVAIYAVQTRFALEGAGAHSILISLCTCVVMACMEELGFRGYPLRTLHARFGLWPSQIVVAVAFALSHFAYGLRWQSIVADVIPGALLFGAAAIASRGLALPIGLHAASNIGAWWTGEKPSPILFLLATAAFWLFARRDTAER